MTSNFAKTLAIGSCAIALLAFTGTAQAQRWGYTEGTIYGSYYPWTRYRLLPDCPGVGRTVTLPLNTGTGGPLGAADLIWTVAPGPTAYSTSSLWLANTASTKWIQPDPAGKPVHFPEGTYVYRTQFATPVDPYLYDSITITGKYAADDEAVIKLNGVPMAPQCTPGSSGTACFKIGKTVAVAGWPRFTRNPTSVWFTTAFVNEITVEVSNSGARYSGLFADLVVTAECSKCTSPLPAVYTEWCGPLSTAPCPPNRR